MSCIQPMERDYQRRDENAATDAGHARDKTNGRAHVDDSKGGCGGASLSVAAAERADFTICHTATISNVPTTG